MTVVTSAAGYLSEMGMIEFEGWWHPNGHGGRPVFPTEFPAYPVATPFHPMLPLTISPFKPMETGE